MQILGLLGKTDKQGGLVREKKGDGGEGRGGETSLIDECFQKADVITECLFSVTALMTKNDNNARPPSEFSECAPFVYVNDTAPHARMTVFSGLK